MKGNTVKIIIIIFVLGIVLLISGFMLFNNSKDKNKDKTNVNQFDTSNLKDISISEGVVPIINGNYNSYGCKDLEFSFFMDKKITKDDLDKDFVISTILNKLNIHGIEFKEGDTFTSKDVRKYIDMLYGKDYEYSYNSIDNNCPKVSYDDKTKKYTVKKKDCELLCDNRSLKKIISAKQNDKILQIYYRVIFIENKKYSYQYYTDYQKKNKINISIDSQKYNYSNLEDGLTEEQINKGSLYRVTFVKENDNYIFLMSEPVNE